MQGNLESDLRKVVLYILISKRVKAMAGGGFQFFFSLSS